MEDFVFHGLDYKSYSLFLIANSPPITTEAEDLQSIFDKVL
jgi:hypothetical protein